MSDVRARPESGGAVGGMADLLDSVEVLRASARRGRPLIILGFLGILAAFVFFTVYLYQQRALAVRQGESWHREALTWQARAESVERRLDATRTAVRARNLAEADRLLRIAIAETQQLSEDAETPPPVTAAADPRASPARGAPAAPKTIVTPPPPAPAAGARPQLVYIQFAGSMSRDSIVELNHALRKSAWRVQGPSGERVETAAGLNEVRYSAPADREAAEALAAAISSAGITGRTVVARRVSIISPGTLEAWISN